MTKVELPSYIEKPRLTMELTLLDDLMKNDPFFFVTKVAEFVSTLKPKLGASLKSLKNSLNFLCACLSAASSERSYSALKELKT